ncbi:MAG: L-serine ammonia-lyase [Pirellulales bacterium]
MLSVFELFKVGIGPSSSHTVGPMVAGLRFAEELRSSGSLKQVASVRVELFSSLALTGKGHATDTAVTAGLMGFHPATVDIDAMQKGLEEVAQSKQLALLGTRVIPFDPAHDLIFHFDQALAFHPNAVRFTALAVPCEVVMQRTFYSVGGGFVLRDDETSANAVQRSDLLFPFPFTNAEQLMAMCKDSGKSIDELVHANERVLRSDDEIGLGCDRLWEVMEACIHRGCRTEGVLPGGLQVKRRAPVIYRSLKDAPMSESDPLKILDWVSLFALAVNEENAAGGQVVTAPTNGAAGVIPAVLKYYVKFVPGANREGIHRFLKTAAAIGMLYKRNASLSAAEMGCQGEVGVACSMAAAGLAACMGGTVAQIENAAEIGMEHNLGLTCDPVRGLVQIPCIERNTMGATKAINAARLAVLYGDGTHRVALDRVIETMRQTGVDMQSKYKETSLGGLAVNVVNC